MRVVEQSQWGLLLEHDQMPFFIPIGNKNPMAAMFANQIKIKKANGEDLVVVVRGNDRPFFIDREGVSHIIYEGGEYERYIDMIKQVIVYFFMSQSRQK